MYTVKLNELKYRAGHGLFGQEELVGNDYVVTVEVTKDLVLSTQNDLNTLIDYSLLKDLIDQRMSVDTPLLEDLVAHMVMDIQRVYPKTQGKIRIQKIQPPFGGRCHSSEVEYTF